MYFIKVDTPCNLHPTSTYIIFNIFFTGKYQDTIRIFESVMDRFLGQTCWKDLRKKLLLSKESPIIKKSLNPFNAK